MTWILIKHCGNHLITYAYQVIMPYILSLYRAVCQLDLNKTEMEETVTDVLPMEKQ